MERLPHDPRPVDAGPAPGRPVARAGLVERASAWVAWFGPARLVTAAASTLVVAAGAWWLVRTPPPATEAVLPTVGVVTTPPGATRDTSPEPSAAGPPPGTVAPSAAVVVHVVGEVVAPGIYELATGSRLHDAITAAGGPGERADPGALNLAAPVVDGSRIHVPAIGEEPEPVVSPTPASTGPGDPGVVLDLNRATVDELDTLPGVGPATATAIVAERDAGGPFLTVDDLERVPGIGPAKLESIRPLVTT